MSETALHHEIHSALHSFIDESNENDLLWTDIGIIERARTYVWHAMINCRAKYSGTNSEQVPVCTVEIPHEFCFTGSTERARKNCFRKKLEGLEKAANDPSQNSLAQLAMKLAAQRDHDTQGYYSHDPVPRYPWITEKPGGTETERFSRPRHECIPDGYTGVMFPLMLSHRTKRGLAGCVIVCGKIESRLWMLLPRMKAAALALLEPKRDLLVLSEDDFVHPAKGHLAWWLNEYPPSKSLFASGRDHSQCLSNELLNGGTALSKIFQKYQGSGNLENRRFFKALLHWRTPSGKEAGTDFTTCVCESTRQFTVRPLVQFVNAACGGRVLRAVGITHFSFPTNCGGLALAGLLSLWWELNADQTPKKPMHIGALGDQYIYWSFDLASSGFGTLFNRFLIGPRGTTLRALQNVCVGTFAYPEAHKELGRVLQRESLIPVMHVQFLPKQGRTEAQLRLVWRLGQQETDATIAEKA